MSPRRGVRFTDRFFEDLDRQLPAERGPFGQPSAHDFLTYEVAEIREWFATRFDELPLENPGRSDYRVLIASGDIVRFYAVVGRIAPDGAIELVQLDVELGWPDDDVSSEPDDA